MNYSPVNPPDHQLYARSFADVYDAWYGELDDPAHLVRAIANQCRDGATVVELGSGTGRLATPLNNAGFVVQAIDISVAMLTAAAPGPHQICADITTLPLRTQSADAVVIAYNTLFNVTSPELQQRCIAEAARLLTPDGVVAIEGFIAPVGIGTTFGVSTKEHPTDTASTLSIVSGPHPKRSDIIVGAHIEHGVSRTCRPWQLVYQSPVQLDASANKAGLRLCHRDSDWAGTAFDADGHRHVSWYKQNSADLP